MNNLITCSSAILCSLLATGCSTLTTTQTEKVTTTAENYTGFMIKLLDDTKTKVINMDTKQLAESRSTESKEANKKKLSEKNAELSEWVAAANQLKEQNMLLQKYFRALGFLIKAPPGSEMSQPITGISLSISKMNQTVADRQGKKYRNRTLTEEQQFNVASLSETLVSSHYSDKVKRVLIRDRNIINQQIALHKQQLEMLASIYKRRDRLDNADHLANKVVGPFISVSPKNHYDSVTWSDHRNKWFEREDPMTEFDNAKDAGEAFREAWRDILKGNKDVGAVNAILGKVSGVVENTYQLRDSYRNPQLPPQNNIPVMLQTPQ